MREPHQILTERSYNRISSREKVKFILYKGSSMSSTLQDMDVLFYMSNKRIRTGDIVVIKVSEYERKVIHRVISVDEKGIRTMGDCNPRPDSWLLRPEQILGVVVYGYRGRRQFCILGGPAGLIQMFRVRIKHRIIKAAYPILRTIFYYFPLSRLVTCLIQPQTIKFKRPEGNETHLLVHGRVIGRRLPGQSWVIKPPFNFFIDEASILDYEVLWMVNTE